jgi:hypothetical protein
MNSGMFDFHKKIRGEIHPARASAARALGGVTRDRELAVDFTGLGDLTIYPDLD